MDTGRQRVSSALPGQSRAHPYPYPAQNAKQKGGRRQGLPRACAQAHHQQKHPGQIQAQPKTGLQIHQQIYKENPQAPQKMRSAAEAPDGYPGQSA